MLEALDDVAPGRLRDAVESEGRDPARAREHAEAAVERSVAALAEAGVEVSGEVCSDDPVPAVVAAARQRSADEVIVVTEPHLVEETLRRDWASRVRDALALPVLHVVAGTDRVVS